MKDNKNQKSLKKNIFLSYLKTFMRLVFPLITFPYASRILLPDGIGKINFAGAVVQYFIIIAMLGINTYGIRECAKVRDNKYELSKVTLEIFLINTVSTLLSYILFFFFLFLVPKFNSYRVLLFVYSITIFFNTIGVEWIYCAIEDYEYITFRSIFFQIFSLIALFLFVKTKEDCLKYALISVFSNVGSNICNFVHVRKFIEPVKFAFLEFKKHLKPIFILFSMALISSIYTIFDSTMLGFLSSDFEVGIYTAGTKINKLVISMITAGSSVLLPRLSYYVKDSENHQKFYELVEKSFYLLIGLSLPCSIGLTFIARPLMELLSGEAFINAIPVMRIMNPIVVFISISNLVGIQIFTPLGKEKYTIFSISVGAVLNFVLNLILIPKYNSLGAAIATLVAEFFVFSIQLCFINKIISLKKIFNIFIYYSFGVILFSIPCACVHYYSHLSEYSLMLFDIVISVLIYFFYLLFTKNTILISILNKVLKKR